MREKALAILLGLFVICFLAIVIEETFFGGRRRRRLESMKKQQPVKDKQS